MRSQLGAKAKTKRRCVDHTHMSPDAVLVINEEKQAVKITKERDISVNHVLQEKLYHTRSGHNSKSKFL